MSSIENLLEIPQTITCSLNIKHDKYPQLLKFDDTFVDRFNIHPLNMYS